MKILKAAILISVFALSSGANAATVSYNGYSLDTGTNIVTGGGLEWLQWDATVGMSINSALAAYAGDGWRLASNTEMSGLFNAFTYGGFTFDTLEDTVQNVYSPYSTSTSDLENDVRFIALYGTTGELGSDAEPDREFISAAYFGQDSNSNGYYNQAFVKDDYTSFSGSNEHEGQMHLGPDSSVMTGTTSSVYGVALVRLSPVPIPAAAWLFGSALLGLIGVARRNKA